VIESDDAAPVSGELQTKARRPENEMPRTLNVLVTFHTSRERKAALAMAVARLKGAGWDQAGVQGIMNLWIERHLDAFLDELLTEVADGKTPDLKREIADG
jgi:hypothetical protein